jgi:CDP-glucose 4,6-dehydratase
VEDVVSLRTAFVTGAYGLLGAALVKALRGRGVDVVVLRRDRPVLSSLGLSGLEPQVTVVDGDCRDADTVQRTLAEYEVDTVFHLAAQTLVGVALRSPAATFDANVHGTWTVLEACRLAEVPRVVVASSDKAYGHHDELPYREDFALEPRYPYDVSKAAADLIARSYWHAYRLPVAVTRFANLYGPGELNFSRLIPEAVSAAIAGRPPVIRSDGTPERDFLYVEDAAHAYLAICDALDEGPARGEAFNAGGGRPHSVRKVVETICRLAGAGVQPDIRGQGTPAGEIDRQYVDSGKIERVCGWRPRIDLEEGLRRTVEWYRAHPEALAPPPAG